MRITVVSPHRDDAAFSVGLSMEHWLGAGHKVQVLNCFTQSAFAPYSDVETVHANDRVSFVSAVRKREDVAWNKLLGRKLQFVDLDLMDAPLRLGCEVREVLTIPVRPGDRAVSRVKGAIAKMARSGSSGALVLPLAIGEHIDHRVTRLAAIEALAEASLPIAFYEDLPYSAWQGAADLIEGAARDAEFDLKPVFAARQSDGMVLHVDRKRRMAECYDSQIDSEVAQQIATFAGRYGGRERMWANTAWRESALMTEGSG